MLDPIYLTVMPFSSNPNWQMPFTNSGLEVCDGRPLLARFINQETFCLSAFCGGRSGAVQRLVKF